MGNINVDLVRIYEAVIADHRHLLRLGLGHDRGRGARVHRIEHEHLGALRQGRVRLALLLGRVAGGVAVQQLAVAAQRLRELHIVRGLREEEVGVAPSARQSALSRPVKNDHCLGKRTVLHRCHLLVTDSSVLGNSSVSGNKKAADPGRVPRPEGCRLIPQTGGPQARNPVVASWSSRMRLSAETPLPGVGTALGAGATQTKAVAGVLA